MDARVVEVSGIGIAYIFLIVSFALGGYMGVSGEGDGLSNASPARCFLATTFFCCGTSIIATTLLQSTSLSPSRDTFMLAIAEQKKLVFHK